MAFKLVGMRKVDMKSQDGKEIKGYSLFFLEPLKESVGSGFSFVLSRGKQSSLFVNEDQLHALGLVVGQNYNFYYDQYGKIIRESITPDNKK